MAFNLSLCVVERGTDKASIRVSATDDEGCFRIEAGLVDNIVGKAFSGFILTGKQFIIYNLFQLYVHAHTIVNMERMGTVG